MLLKVIQETGICSDAESTLRNNRSSVISNEVEHIKLNISTFPHMSEWTHTDTSVQQEGVSEDRRNAKVS